MKSSQKILAGLFDSRMLRVTINDFRKVGQKGLKNDDKVGQQLIQKGG